MSEQSQPSSPQPQSTPDPQTSVVPPANPGGTPVSSPPSLPISPFTGEPYDPAWGVPLKKGGGNEQTIQQIVKHEIERKAIQSDNEAKK